MRFLLHFLSAITLCGCFEPPKYKFEELYAPYPPYKRNASATYASSLVQQPVYVSMTTMSSRIGKVHHTIRSIFEGLIIPDRLYLFISRESFLLDKGIANESAVPAELQSIVREQLYPISIVYTNNMGSHRKLLPLLAKKWNEDCAIATFDDEPKDDGKIKQYLSQLVKYYLASNRSAVVSLKARRIGMCRDFPWDIRNYGYWGVSGYGKMELFLLPTGTGSVLYRPRFLHPVVFDPHLRNLTFTADDLMFRLSALVNRVKVVTGCRDAYKRDRRGTLTITACPSDAEIGSETPYAPPPAQQGRRLLASANITSTSPTVRAYTLPSFQTRRRLEQSLAQLNLHKRGNDYAWRNATSYLLQQRLLNLTQLAAETMPMDRGNACDPSRWDKEPLKKRTDQLGKELLKIRRECSLSFCKPTSTATTPVFK